MDKYLLEILKEFNTIIIPGLGALTITDATKGEIMLMTYLKHDDGQLAKHIAEKEGLDETEAKNLIAKYVREIMTKLDQGESYDMFEFGSFYKNEEGEVDFKKWEKQKKEPATEEKSKTVEKPAKEKAEIKKEKKPTTPKKATPKKEQDAPKNLKEDKPVTVKKDKPKKIKSEVEKVEPKEKTNVPADKKIEEVKEEKVEKEPKKELNVAEKEELAKNEEKLAVLKKTKVDPQERKKRSTGFWILIVLISVIGIGSVYVALNYEDVKQHIPFLADNTEEENESDPYEDMKEIINGESDVQIEDLESSDNEDDTVIEEEEVIIEEATEEIIEEKEPVVVEEEIKTAPPVSSSGNYHIIAGAFSSASNAERLATSFRDQGYNVIIGQVNGLNMVSIGSYATASDAQTALPQMQTSASSAWIYHGSL